MAAALQRGHGADCRREAEHGALDGIDLFGGLGMGALPS